MSSTAIAHDYVGWGEIRPALIDGVGDEFVVDATYDVDFGAGTEFDKVLAAANWVASNMVYAYDPVPPGDVWTSSDQSFEELTGDCEDFAILLCALMRFNLEVPANRVWVQAGRLVDPGEEEKPPIFGHAVVAYKAERGGIFYIEPQWGGYPYRGSFPSISHWYYKRPPVTGESAMLRFNDDWVKGGGWWLAGPRK
ncbi:MAG: transglutaminase domain-containing protein [Proteobacteria bacterium]|nr:transglutaminase domain-containing protein [Pseudomonadota bacterium]